MNRLDPVFIADDLARLNAAHLRFLGKLQEWGTFRAHGAAMMAGEGAIRVTAMGHTIEVTHRPMFRDGRPLCMEYAFTVRQGGAAVPILSLGLVQTNLYDLAEPGELFEKVNSRRLCDSLLRLVADRLLASTAFVRDEVSRA